MHKSFDKLSVDMNNAQWQALALTSPMIGYAFLTGAINIIAGIYAKYFGLALTSIATVLLLSRLFDAITDPLIGYYSDCYKRKAGTRKPFVLVGGLCLIVTSYGLFVPAETATVYYFATWSLAFYLALTVMTIPILAWASELTAVPEERTRLFTLWSIMGMIGGLFFCAVPYLSIFDSREFTPEVLEVAILVGACLILPGLYFALRFTPDGPLAAEGMSQQRKENIFKVFYKREAMK